MDRPTTPRGRPAVRLRWDRDNYPTLDLIFWPYGASAASPAREVVVRYPFHPLTGQSFLILGEHEHSGAPHVLVRGTDGTTHLLPAWMTSPEAGAIEIVTVPRLAVNRLFELRSVLDRIMIASSSGEIAPTGGFGHEEAEALAIRLVHHTAAADRMAGASAREGTGTARSPSGGSKQRGGRAGRGITPARGRS